MSQTPSLPLSSKRSARAVSTRPASVPLGTDVVDDSLDTLSGLYDYNHWVYSMVRPYVSGRVLEVGCGVGTITRFLSMNADEVVGVDPVGRFVDRFKQAFAHMSHVSAHQGFLHDLPRPEDECHMFDTVVNCNVLEHIQDDVGAVATMAQQLRPGGKLTVFVPAGPLAFGRLDRELGHFRRYTKRSLQAVFEAAGLQWVEGRYCNGIGLLGWWLNSVVLRKRLVPTKQAQAFNRLVPLLSALERMVSLPFGQSVIGVGRKPTHSAGTQPLRDETDFAKAA